MKNYGCRDRTLKTRQLVAASPSLVLNFVGNPIRKLTTSPFRYLSAKHGLFNRPARPPPPAQYELRRGFSSKVTYQGLISCVTALSLIMYDNAYSCSIVTCDGQTLGVCEIYNYVSSMHNNWRRFPSSIYVSSAIMPATRRVRNLPLHDRRKCDEVSNPTMIVCVPPPNSGIAVFRTRSKCVLFPFCCRRSLEAFR